MTPNQVKNLQRKPLLKVSLIPGFKEIVASIKITDTEQVKSAGMYLQEVIEHMESQEFKTRRQFHGDRIKLSKLKIMREKKLGKPVWIVTISGEEVGTIDDKNETRAEGKAQARWGEQAVITHHVI